MVPQNPNSSDNAETKAHQMESWFCRACSRHYAANSLERSRSHRCPICGYYLINSSVEDPTKNDATGDSEMIEVDEPIATETINHFHPRNNPQTKDDLYDEFWICRYCKVGNVFDATTDKCQSCGKSKSQPPEHNSAPSQVAVIVPSTPDETRTTGQEHAHTPNQDKSKIRRICKECGLNLDEAPAILIDSDCFCYADAKRIHKRKLAEARRQEKELNKDHSTILAEYHVKKNTQDNDIKAWRHASNHYASENTFTQWKWLWCAAAVIPFFVINPVFGILAVIICPFIIMYVDADITNKRLEEYTTKHPPAAQHFFCKLGLAGSWRC